MRLLIDTNIFLEILLEQSRAEEAKELLRKVDQHDFFISDFALHSVGLLLLRQRKPEVFRSFLSDIMLFFAGSQTIQTLLSPESSESTVSAVRRPSIMSCLPKGIGRKPSRVHSLSKAAMLPQG
ncbi:MAG: hypothetical protein AABO57_20960 [Acidobacteriota bacterium]